MGACEADETRGPNEDGLVVLQSTDPQANTLRAAGWRVVARSFGAELDVEDVDVDRLGELVARVRSLWTLRELTPSDVPAVLVLDAATIGDYPGSVATRHQQLTTDTARLSPVRRAFGAFDAAGFLVAMTYLDLDEDVVETDFTVVDPALRGQGLGSALKALSVLTLCHEGVRRFRTGGSLENVRILAADAALGYVRDEEWLTLAPPVS